MAQRGRLHRALRTWCRPSMPKGLVLRCAGKWPEAVPLPQLGQFRNLRQAHVHARDGGQHGEPVHEPHGPS